MAKVFNMTDIELIAENSEQAKQAKQAIINILREYDVDADGIVQMYAFASENKSLIKGAVSDLKNGKGIGSIITRVLPKLLSKK